MLTRFRRNRNLRNSAFVEFSGYWDGFVRDKKVRDWFVKTVVNEHSGEKQRVRNNGWECWPAYLTVGLMLGPCLIDFTPMGILLLWWCFVVMMFQWEHYANSKRQWNLNSKQSVLRALSYPNHNFLPNIDRRQLSTELVVWFFTCVFSEKKEHQQSTIENLCAPEWWFRVS